MAYSGGTIEGTSHSDFLFGKDGNDTIHGRAGADFLFGRGGNDNLFGDEGNDVETGGSGTDTFHFKPGTGHDRVTDLHVKSEGDNVVLYGVTADDIHTEYLASINTTILFIDAPGSGTITFVGENATDVMSAISFQPLDDYLV